MSPSAQPFMEMRFTCTYEAYFHMKGYVPVLFWNRGKGQLGNGLLVPFIVRVTDPALSSSAAAEARP